MASTNGNVNGRRYTAEEVADALRAANGFLTLAAQHLGCSRMTVYRYCRDFACCKEAQEDAREKQKDFTEGKLFSQIKDGNITAIIFYLKTQAKDRGYIERQEMQNLILDMTKLSMEQLERIANGEDPFVVLASAATSASRTGASPA